MAGGWKHAALAAGLLAGTAAQAVELTAIERTWLEAAQPVVVFARQQALPLDIVVQPQPTPGETPLGMAFVDGRCKLVLSMRGNPLAQSTVDSIEPGLKKPVLEAITAHEVGHCWRHVQRHWGTLPQGFREAGTVSDLSREDADRTRAIWRARREEGFADLVGLAWTLKRHPSRYAEVHAWHVRVRSDELAPGGISGAHDTLAWLRLAADRSRFATQAPSIFEQVEPLWRAGLLGDS